MTRRFLLAALGAALALCLSGCIFEPVDKLYALPVLPQEYRELQNTIDATMRELGAEYATINYGSNTSTIQLLDMDGDGDQETAAVFLRVTAVKDQKSGEEKPLRVCLFRQGEDQSYHQVYMLEGNGTSINSVAYEDLTGDGSRELIIFQQDITGEGYNVAEYYDYQDGVMVLSSTGTLSDGLKDVIRADTGLLSDGRPGVYVTLELETGYVTDVLTLDRTGLINVTRDAESGMSLATAWTNTDATTTDINGDGVLEIPRPQLLTPPDEENGSAQYLIYWQQVDSSGRSATSDITYHSYTDGWYFTLPVGWDINNITVTRDDSLSGRGERAVVFYHWSRQGEPEKFLTIYRLTGSNRVSRSKMTGRAVLYSDSNAIYCASFDAKVWRDCGLDLEGIGRRFKPITAAWSSR